MAYSKQKETLILQITELDKKLVLHVNENTFHSHPQQLEGHRYQLQNMITRFRTNITECDPTPSFEPLSNLQHSLLKYFITYLHFGAEHQSHFNTINWRLFPMISKRSLIATALRISDGTGEGGHLLARNGAVLHDCNISSQWHRSPMWMQT